MEEERAYVEPLYDVSIALTRWLQVQYPQLDPFLQIVSALGRFEFYLALLPLIYWCINKNLGKDLAYLLAIGNVVNHLFKVFLRLPRPYWLDAELALSTEASYGFPSGHVQIAAIIYLLLAIRARRRLVWIAAGAAIFLMGFSRVYLGLHFVHDVLGGLLLGVVILAGYFFWRYNFHKQFRNRILGQRLMVAIALPVLLALIFAGGKWLLGGADDTVVWAEFVQEAERTGLDDVTAGIAIVLSLGVGFILEASRSHFIVDGTLLRRGLRYLLGMAVTLLIWRGLGVLFPEDPLWLGLPLRFFRYWLAGMWVAYYAPASFLRLKLAQASPEPDVQLSVSDGGVMGH